MTCSVYVSACPLIFTELSVKVGAGLGTNVFMKVSQTPLGTNVFMEVLYIFCLCRFSKHSWEPMFFFFLQNTPGTPEDPGFHIDNKNEKATTARRTTATYLSGHCGNERTRDWVKLQSQQSTDPWKSPLGPSRYQWKPQNEQGRHR